MYCSPLTCVVFALAKPKFILGYLEFWGLFIYLLYVHNYISLEMKLVFLSVRNAVTLVRSGASGALSPYFYKYAVHSAIV